MGMDAFVRRELWLTLGLLLLLLAVVALSGIFLRDHVTGLAEWVYSYLGFGGLALVLFVSETIVSPLPPDVILWIVASSELSSAWPLPVAILSFLSTLGGHLGWFLGRRLGDTGAVRRLAGRHYAGSVELMHRYGVWAVVLAAVTPVPWSVTSWTAGALRMPWRRYLLGSLTRFPRNILYYLFIHAAFHAPTTDLY